MRAVVVLAPFVLAAACAPSDDEATRVMRQPVINGTVDSTHAAVVSIATSLDATTTGELCTGTIVAPRVILTAGHCTLGQDASSLIVGVGGNAQFPASQLAISAVVTYPGFSGSQDDFAAGLDLGAILLAEDAGIAAVPLAPSSASTLVGASFTVVGYGVSDATNVDSRGLRREGEVNVSAECSALLAFGDASSNACHGDSGGPLLARAADGSESLVGVVSFGDPVRCATSSYAVRVDRYASWIDSLIAGSNDGGDCPSCPPRSEDCTAIDGDAGVDAAGGGADAASEAGARVVAAPPGGGCACAVAGAPSESDGLALAAVGLALTTRARRRSDRTRGLRRARSDAPDRPLRGDRELP